MRMSYGDGSRDPRQLTTSCKGFPPMVTLDIAAHEIGHGVTEHTSGLIYERSYGGINEGLSGARAALGCVGRAVAVACCFAFCASSRSVLTSLSAQLTHFRPLPHPFNHKNTNPNPNQNKTPTDIFAQCVIDYAAKEQNYPRGPDFLVGSLLYPPGANCSRPFLRSMKDPTADNFRSSACWHRKFDVTVRGVPD
jgi:hypothetical protein